MNFKKITYKLFDICSIFFIIFNVFQCTGIGIKINSLLVIALLFTIASVLIYVVSIESAILSLKRFFSKLKSYIKYQDFVVIFFLTVYFFDLLILPHIRSTPVQRSIQDAGMMVMLFLYFPLVILLRMGEINTKKYIRIFLVSTTILAVLYSSVWIAELLYPGSYNNVLSILQNTGLFTIQKPLTGYGMVRIIQTNMLLLGGSLLCNLYFFQIKKINNYFFFFILSFLHLFAIATTFLRSLIFATILAIIFEVILISIFEVKMASFKKSKLRVLYSFLIVFLSFVAVNFVFNDGLYSHISTIFANNNEQNIVIENSDTNGNEPGSEETPNNIYDSNKAREGAKTSNSLRKEQSIELIKSWKEHPFFGQGYGFSIPNYVRSQTQPFLYEVTALSLLMKTGILGVISWLMLAITFFVSNFKKIKNNSREGILLVCLMVLTALFVQTNPYLFNQNTMSIMLYLLILSFSEENKLKNMNM